MIKAVGPNNQDIQVALSYESLANLCYYCGIIGHLVKDVVIELILTATPGNYGRIS